MIRPKSGNGVLHKHIQIALLAIAAAMGGCATDPSSQRPVVFQLDAPDDGFRINVEDHRPAETKTFRPPSFGKSEYKLGDENFSPDRLKALALRFQNKLGPSYAGKTIDVRSFEVTIFKPPAPSRPGAAASFGALSAIIGPLFAETTQTLIALMDEERRETVIVLCQVRGSVAGLFFRGSSDRVVPDPKSDLAKAVREVIREAIDGAADSILEDIPVGAGPFSSP